MGQNAAGNSRTRALTIPEALIGTVAAWGAFLALIIVPTVVLADSEPEIVVTETISFDLEDFYVEPGRLEVVRGTELIGVVTNRGKSQHNLVIAEDDGTARLVVPRNHPDGAPWVITAELDGDLAYLQPDKRPWVVDDVDQSGRGIPETYDVMLYTERGVYRPGDTIHLTGIIRDAFGGTPPPFPISLKVKRPDGRRVAERIRHRSQIQSRFIADQRSGQRVCAGGVAVGSRDHRRSGRHADQPTCRHLQFYRRHQRNDRQRPVRQPASGLLPLPPHHHPRHEQTPIRLEC